MNADGERVSSIMTKHVVSVSPVDPLRKALELMVWNDVGSVLVLENGKLMGIVTERDVTRFVVIRDSDVNRSVKEAMTTPVTTVNSDTPIIEAVQTMVSRGCRRLPVTEKEKVIGVVTMGDVMKWLMTRPKPLLDSLSNGNAGVEDGEAPRILTETKQ